MISILTSAPLNPLSDTLVAEAEVSSFSSLDEGKAAPASVPPSLAETALSLYV